MSGGCLEPSGTFGVVRRCQSRPEPPRDGISPLGPDMKFFMCYIYTFITMPLLNQQFLMSLAELQAGLPLCHMSGFPQTRPLFRRLSGCPGRCYENRARAIDRSLQIERTGSDVVSRLTESAVLCKFRMYK